MIKTDKSEINTVCIDDFALKKRHRYGTIMIDVNTHKIIDMIESRKKDDVIEWLRTFPNLSIVCRALSLTYKDAISKAHPNSIQVSDKCRLSSTFGSSSILMKGAFWHLIFFIYSPRLYSLTS